MIDLAKWIQFIVNNACDDIEVIIRYTYESKHVVEKGKKLVTSTDFAQLKGIEITVARREREGDGS